MSLTKHLSDPRSPVKKFFKENFENIPAFVRQQNALLRQRFPLVYPRVNRNSSVVGTALDYRIRTFFGHEEDLVGIQALEMMADFIGQTRSSLEGYKQEFYRLRSAVQGKAPQAETETEYLRHCVLLARAEVLIRAGRFVPEVVSFVHDVGRNGFKKRYLMSATSHVDLSEIQDMARAFAQRYWQQLSRMGPVRLNPSFGDFSSAMGGADADLIVGNRLYDIKTTKGLITGKYLSQVIAYSFLDHQVEAVGFYFARHCALVDWDLERVIGEISSTKMKLEQAREMFQQLVMSMAKPHGI